MQLSLYEKTTGQTHIILQAAVAINFALATTVYFAWTHIAAWVDPIVFWAFDIGVGRGVPQPLAYPFVTLWLGPLLTGLISWMLLKARVTRLAWPVALLAPSYTVLAFIAALIDGTPYN